MKTYKKITKEIEEIDEIKCNKCGEDCDASEMLNAELIGGYGAKQLEDMTGYKFDLCGKCLKELFSTFVIPVSTKEYNFG